VGKRRAKHPFEDNPFAEDFLEWMGSPEGQHSVDALDVVFAALEKADVDARRRKIVWEDGKRLSIPESAERIHTEYPDLPREAIETHVVGWLENFAPQSYSERQLDELDRLTERWLDDYECKSDAAAK
jgi:hypothetical protein